MSPSAWYNTPSNAKSSAETKLWQTSDQYMSKRGSNRMAVDTAMRQALICLEELQEELKGIAETIADMDAIMDHMDTLQSNLEDAHTQRFPVSFSEVNMKDLKGLGVNFARLEFDESILDHLIEDADEAFHARISTLSSRMEEIHACVNTGLKDCSRMIIDAILLCFRNMVRSSEFDVAILHAYNLTPPEGVELHSKDTERTLHLTGSVDYAVAKYKADDSNRDLLLTSSGVGNHLLEGISDHRLYITAARSLFECVDINSTSSSDVDKWKPALHTSKAEAISQAIAAATVEKKNHAHFCLTNGKQWRFFVLNRDSEDEPWAVYMSLIQEFGGHFGTEFKVAENELKRLLTLLSEWFNDIPSDGLYTLTEGWSNPVHDTPTPKTKGYKRKRSVRDSDIDMDKMIQASASLEALSLRLGLEGVSGTNADTSAIMGHMNALSKTLEQARSHKISFSNATSNDLNKLGLFVKPSGSLSFDTSICDDLVESAGNHFQTQMSLLKSRIEEIYSCVNMEYEAASRMVLDAILLSFRRLNHDNQFDVAILPDFRLAPTEGVKLYSKSIGHTLYFTGSVDYAVVKYRNNAENRIRLLTPLEAEIQDIIMSRLFLIEAKPLAAGSSLGSFKAEAISQAVAAATARNKNGAHFCLSNGKDWIFFVLQRESEDHPWMVYESVPYGIAGQEADGIYTAQVKESTLKRLMILISSWMKESPADNLFTITGGIPSL